MILSLKCFEGVLSHLMPTVDQFAATGAIGATCPTIGIVAKRNRDIGTHPFRMNKGQALGGGQARPRSSGGVVLTVVPLRCEV